MRVALLGNLCNTAYVFAKALRKKGLDADVFITKKERTQIAAYPEWEDPHIKSDQVPWIHYYDQRNPLDLAQTSFKLREYDLLHAFGIPNTYCQFLGKPLLVHALGADLKELAHERSLLGRLIRRAFERAPRVLCSDIDHLPHMERLKLEQAQYFPAAVEVDKYGPDAQIEGAPTKDESRLVFFHAAFLDWTRGQLTSKRNDLFFKAFARFSKTRDDLLLRIIAAGPDTESSKQLIADLGLGSKVEFLAPMNKQELLRNYLACDIIVDQFGMPKFGVNALEGMACAKPVFLNIDHNTASRCYAELPPVLTASSEEAILAQLQKIKGKDELRVRGTAARQWVLKYHCSEKVAEKLVAIYDELCSHGYGSDSVKKLQLSTLQRRGEPTRV